MIYIIYIYIIYIYIYNFVARLKQANLASKSGAANLIHKTDFDNKAEDVTSNKNELNKLSNKVTAISTKGLTKYLIHRYSILNRAKHFSSGIFKYYLVLIPAIKHVKYFHGTTKIYSWNSNGMLEENVLY